MVGHVTLTHSVVVRIHHPQPNYALIAQLVEHLFCNQDVRRSIRRGGTKIWGQ